MAEQFDPYRKWLGIPPSEQPPNYYRLLGIALFEPDPDVIANAADRQMTHVRTFQTGGHGGLSQELLNELSAARVALLDRQKKGRYDAQLRQHLNSTDPESTTTRSVPLGDAPREPLPTGSNSAGEPPEPDVPRVRATGARFGRTSGRFRPYASVRRRKKVSWRRHALVVLLLTVLLGTLLWMLNHVLQSSSPPPLQRQALPDRGP